MPRGQKSKIRAREKRQQARGMTQSPRVPQITAAGEEESSPSSSPACGGRSSPCSSPAACSPPESQGDPPTSSPDAGASGTKSDVGAQSLEEASPIASQAARSAPRSCRDPLTRKASQLVQFLLEKYKENQPITEAIMLKVFSRKYKQHFPEILRRASERMELVFGLELKEVDPVSHSYALVSKLGLSNEGSVSGDKGLPKTGLLMTLLGVIFMKGNRATEEEMWEFLNMLGLYAGRSHLIFGEPHKLITEDLVREKYLVYQQVPNSDPPCHVFLWGPRAYAETSKMKVLEVLAKINDTVPSSFPHLYEEALREEAVRAGGRITGRIGTVVQVRPGPRAMSRRSPHI